MTISGWIHMYQKYLDTTIMFHFLNKYKIPFITFNTCDFWLLQQRSSLCKSNLLNNFQFTCKITHTLYWAGTSLQLGLMRGISLKD